jgi:hypothetical protein
MAAEDTEGKDETGRTQVNDALLDEQAHVLIELSLPCRAVHLEGLPHEFDDREDANRCTMRDL